MPSVLDVTPANHPLVAARRQRNLTQAELARQIGVSRQFLNQMESGRVLPNVAVALQLAVALNCTVEELFRSAVPAATAPVVILADERLHPGARVRLARIETHWVAHPAETADSLAAGFAAADAVLLEEQRVRLLVPEPRIEGNLLLAGCDPAMRLLQPVNSDSGTWHWLDCGSGRALDLLAAGKVHVAGIHYSGPGSRGNVRELAARNPDRSWAMVGFTCWEQGWLLRTGMGGRFTGPRTLRRGDWVLANRERSTAARHWLDQVLEEAGVSSTQVRGYETEHRSAGDAARAVAEGRADIAIASRAVALAHGLDFAAAEAVNFDLVAPAVWWRSVQGQAFRARIRALAQSGEIGTLPGYSTTETGSDRPRPTRLPR